MTRITQGYTYGDNHQVPRLAQAVTTGSRTPRGRRAGRASRTAQERPIPCSISRTHRLHPGCTRPEWAGEPEQTATRGGQRAAGAPAAPALACRLAPPAPAGGRQPAAQADKGGKRHESDPSARLRAAATPG